jgi:hypothetical protein
MFRRREGVSAPSTTHLRCVVPLPRFAVEEQTSRSAPRAANTSLRVLLHCAEGTGEGDRA